MMLPPGRVAKTGTGMLRGRVVAADTGSIVRRAQVRITSPDIGSKTAFTDAQGRYEFQKLPAGRFNVSVSKSGFVTMQFGPIACLSSQNTRRRAPTRCGQGGG